MSMIYWVLGLTPAQMGALRATPLLASGVARVAQHDQYKTHIDVLMERMSPEQREQFEASQATLEANPATKEWKARIAEARERIAPHGPFEEALSLEKSWHMLHYLFTGHVGTSSAPGDLLLTGEEVGDNVGYGPARLHEPPQTRDFGRFLETQDLARLQARLDLRTMDGLGVYGMPMGPASDAEFESELREEVGFYFSLLRDYVRTMSDKGNGLLLWVS